MRKRYGKHGVHNLKMRGGIAVGVAISSGLPAHDARIIITIASHHRGYGVPFRFDVRFLCNKSATSAWCESKLEQYATKGGNNS